MRNIFYLFLCLALSSCFSSINPNAQADYIASKKSFDTVLTSHLPRILPNEYYGYSYMHGQLGKYQMSRYLRVKLRFLFEKKYLKEKDKLINKSIYKVGSTDSCLIRIFTKNVYGDKELKNSLDDFNKTCADGYPIPDFEAFSSEDEFHRTLNEIYIIDADTTISLDNKARRLNIKYLPENWEEGYSIGFTTNDQYLLIDYWIVVW